MPMVAIDLLFGLLVLATGVALGWWLRTREPTPTPSDPAGEARQAREVLGRLHELATRVASDVGAHTDRVEAINEQLHSSSGAKHEAVLLAVTELIEANSRMQGQLGSAKQKLKEQAAQVEKHAEAARTDALTGLANRRAFDEEMSRRLERWEKLGETFSIVMFDVDHFKRFNDTYGHQAGDAVLRMMGELLRNTARKGDLVVRYGGEEFAMILSRTPVAEAKHCAERARRHIAERAFHCDGQELRVTASLGVAQIFQGETVPQLIDRADAALYASKAAGRDCVHWHDGTTPHLLQSADSIPASEPEAPPTAPPASAPPPTELPAKQEPNAESRPRAAADQSDREDPVAGKTVVGQITMSNRTEFCIILARRLAEWRRGGANPSVIMIRIDHFQRIVEEYGERAGCLVLKATAHFLSAAIRDMDMVAHCDTATFVVLFPGTWMANVVGISERLREAIAKCHLPTERGPMHFTVSIGGANAMESDDTKRMLERAETSLGIAFEAGGNCSMFHNGARSETVEAAMERAANCA